MRKLVSLFLALLLSAGAARAALSPAPTGSIESFYATLLATMKSGTALGQGGRYARLEPVVEQLFDVPQMARLAVGPSWDGLGVAQQQQVVAAFGHYIAATYADRFDSYSGETFQVVGETPTQYGALVTTRILKSDGKPVTLDYLMRRNGAGIWQITDVYLDGAISQLAVQRSEFSSILRDRGVGGLVAALQSKADLLTKSASS